MVMATPAIAGRHDDRNCGPIVLQEVSQRRAALLLVLPTFIQGQREHPALGVLLRLMAQKPFRELLLLQSAAAQESVPGHYPGKPIDLNKVC